MWHFDFDTLHWPPFVLGLEGFVFSFLSCRRSQTSPESTRHVRRTVKHRAKRSDRQRNEGKKTIKRVAIDGGDNGDGTSKVTVLFVAVLDACL